MAQHLLGLFFVLSDTHCLRLRNDVDSSRFFCIHSRKEDSVLPHAYYWKDDGFKTEFCKTDNWNHLWFIITVSSYLKHSADKKTVALLYPIVQKSLEIHLTINYELSVMSFPN